MNCCVITSSDISVDLQVKLKSILYACMQVTLNVFSKQTLMEVVTDK